MYLSWTQQCDSKNEGRNGLSILKTRVNNLEGQRVLLGTLSKYLKKLNEWSEPSNTKSILAVKESAQKMGLHASNLILVSMWIFDY